MKHILILILVVSVWTENGFQTNDCYSCRDTYGLQFCNHNNQNAYCCPKFSSDYKCAEVYETTSCSSTADSSLLYPIFCLGITPVQCGNVQSLTLTASTVSEDVYVKDIRRSENTACYWKIRADGD